LQLTILKIILWPRNTDLRPRVVPFEPGKINVISGDNGTGKSTLTWIVDYCLGSEKCSIPVGLIRELTGWFGLHLKLANTEMIIARRNPEDQQSTTDLYWNEGLKLEVPAIVQKNARVDDLKNRFNQIVHLPSLDFSTDDVVGYAGRPSSRDMAAFNFQPQHIVANPYTFFFKADTTEHREKPLHGQRNDSGRCAKPRQVRNRHRDRRGILQGGRGPSCANCLQL
jgi:energy-coupling factor transporter ATP-binding protein EcfA2